MECAGYTKSELIRWKELLLISIPFIFLQVFIDFSLFADRYFLSQFSLEHLEVCVYGNAAAAIFEAMLVRSVFLTKTFIGKAWGSKDFQSMGPIIWQMIWFCLLSNSVVIPTAALYYYWYFPDPSQLETHYYFGLISINFLFPISVVLSAFHTGQGKKGTVTICLIGTSVLFVLLDRALVLGVPEVVPAMGIYGSLVSLATCYIVLNLILFGIFLSPFNRRKYGTSNWRIDIPHLVKLAKVSIPYGSAMALAAISWSLNTRTIKLAGDDYFLCLSLIGSFSLIFSTPTLILTQGLMVLLSQRIGARDVQKLKEYFLSALRMCILISVCLAIPLWLKNEAVLSWFFKNFEQLDEGSIRALEYASISLVFYFFILGVERICTALFNAAGETKYVFYYLVLYLILGVPSVYFWTIILETPPWAICIVVGFNMVAYRIIPYLFQSYRSIWSQFNPVAVERE